MDYASGEALSRRYCQEVGGYMEAGEWHNHSISQDLGVHTVLCRNGYGPGDTRQEALADAVGYYIAVDGALGRRAFPQQARDFIEGPFRQFLTSGAR